mmetsp:Transcript_36086/g.75943  ORF Transcript_36086/g.75943 Transcript_36086/m.75943 type:complete len:416 (-) Transcript_36086:138-1385(-)
MAHTVERTLDMHSTLCSDLTNALDACASEKHNFAGKEVELCDLQGRADLNGKRGRVLKFDTTSGRFCVQVDSSDLDEKRKEIKLAVRASNLKWLDSRLPASPDQGTKQQWSRLLENTGLQQFASIDWHLFETDLFKARHSPKEMMTILLRAGVANEADSSALVKALLSLGEQRASGLNAISQIMAARLAAEEKNSNEVAAEDAKAAVTTACLSSADAGFRIVNARRCAQPRGVLDDNDVATPPPVVSNSRVVPCVYPTSEQADRLASVLRAHAHGTAIFGAGERFLEGMLERRGLHVWPMGIDVYSDAAHYSAERIYCSQVYRVPASGLMNFPNPNGLALLFVFGVMLPWRAYLARYPQISLVGVVGDGSSADSAIDPNVAALANTKGWRQLKDASMKLDVVDGPPATLVFYEKV